MSAAGGRRRDGVDDALAAWLLARLPAAELAVQLAARADVVLDVVDDAGRTTAAGVGLRSSGTLSGAALWVALAALPGTDPTPLAAPLAPLLAAHGGVELTGPSDAVEPVARALAATSGATARAVVRQRLLAADGVVAPDGVPGRPRPALVGDRLLVAGWLDDFMVEALGATPRGAAAWVDDVADAGTALRLWEVDGSPVSLVQVRPTTATSSRIGPVWTPPGHRRRGYAAALTSRVAADALDAGDERVVLFTDATNPTSNRLYERIGFREVCAHASWAVGAGGA